MMAAFLVSTLSYDEMDHGLAFLFTLPIDRKMYVREKYLFCMGGAVITWFIALILYFAVLTVNHTQTLFEEEMLKGLAFLPIAILFLSLLLPLQLKFGVEKSRLLVIGVSVFTGIMIYFLAEKSGMLDGESTVILSVFGVIGGYSCGYDQPACGSGNGSSVISVQLSYHEKEGIIIFSD